VPKSAKHLLIGSSEAYSGKSAVILGLAHQLKEKGLSISYGKPIGTCLSESKTDNIDEDVRFIAQTLGLPKQQVLPTLLSLDEATITRRLSGIDHVNYYHQLQESLHTSTGDLVLLEGAGTLEEGRLFNLSLLQMTEAIDASVVLVARFRSSLVVESLLSAKQQLGDRLVGVLINDVPPTHLETIDSYIKPFLERHEIEVLGVLPYNDILRSVSVAELVHQLNAEVVCRPDRLDLMVQSLKIGAMNVNSALEYLRKGHNMAVVTGGDRTDIQLAALETSTQCLILTGRLTPNSAVLSRAEDLEIPILSVDLDTLTTVEIIDRTFGQVRLHEPIKVQTVRQMMADYFNVDRLLAKIGMEPVATAS
jgi:BioD-like phosphotransacetylase family protein